MYTSIQFYVINKFIYSVSHKVGVYMNNTRDKSFTFKKPL